MSTPHQAQTLLLRKVLERQGRCWVPVSGDSMLPTLHSGMRVALEAVPFERIEPGDIVGFACQGELFVHRVITHCGGWITTCGDNKPLLDPPVDRDSYIGKAVAYEPDIARGGIGPQHRLDSSGGRARTADLWTLVSSQQDLAEQQQLASAWGIGLHLLTRKGIGIAPAELANFRASLPARALKIGVSSRAVLALPDAVPALRAAQHLVWVLGGHYGHLEQDGAQLLPVDTVDLHVRCGPPYHDLPIQVEIALIIGVMATLGAAQGI